VCGRGGVLESAVGGAEAVVAVAKEVSTAGAAVGDACGWDAKFDGGTSPNGVPANPDGFVTVLGFVSGIASFLARSAAAATRAAFSFSFAAVAS